MQIRKEQIQGVNTPIIYNSTIVDSITATGTVETSFLDPIPSTTIHGVGANYSFVVNGIMEVTSALSTRYIYLRLASGSQSTYIISISSLSVGTYDVDIRFDVDITGLASSSLYNFFATGICTVFNNSDNKSFNFTKKNEGYFPITTLINFDLLFRGGVGSESYKNLKTRITYTNFEAFL